MVFVLIKKNIQNNHFLLKLKIAIKMKIEILYNSSTAKTLINGKPVNICSDIEHKRCLQHLIV